MITLEHVSKKRESFCLKDISFYLPKGYIMGLIGENGSGKTTVLSLITGLIKADQDLERSWVSNSVSCKYSSISYAYRDVWGRERRAKSVWYSLYRISCMVRLYRVLRSDQLDDCTENSVHSSNDLVGEYCSQQYALGARFNGDCVYKEILS